MGGRKGEDGVDNSAGQRGLKRMEVGSGERDEVRDGGEGQLGKVIQALRRETPETTIEVLTPDFRGKEGALEVVIASGPNVFNHNLETVHSLYSSIRPGARYFESLRLLEKAKKLDPAIFTKSGIMVGLGEQTDEVRQVMDDLRSANVDFLTIGQYLAPTTRHAPVARFATPDEFVQSKRILLANGFRLSPSSPLPRSSSADDHSSESLFHPPPPL